MSQITSAGFAAYFPRPPVSFSHRERAAVLETTPDRWQESGLNTGRDFYWIQRWEAGGAPVPPRRRAELRRWIEFLGGQMQNVFIIYQRTRPHLSSRESHPRWLPSSLQAEQKQKHVVPARPPALFLKDPSFYIYLSETTYTMYLVHIWYLIKLSS